jgi:hypothetical protein
MVKLRLIGVSFSAMLALAMPAHAENYAQGVCNDLRHEQPLLKAKISVICHFPVQTKSAILDLPSHFYCAALPGGESLPAIDAESNGPGCGDPFDQHDDGD